MEKGTSIHAPEFALRRFLEIVRQYQSPGQCDIQTEYTEKIEEKTIITSKHYIENIIGIKLEDSFILSVLEKSGCKIEKTEDVLQVTPPWWRLDLYDQDTVTEEIARFFGYDHIPLLAPSIKAKIRKKDSFMLDLKKQTISLSQAKEIISYGIADEEIKKSWQMSQEKEVKLKNPYNDRLTSLTTTHVGNLLEIANKELKLGTKESRLFEINPTWAYDESEHIKEAQTYAFVGYSEDKKKDFYFYRDMLKGIYGFFGYELSFVKKEEDLSLYRHYSEIKSGIYLNNKLIGSCGLVDPLIIYKETKTAFLFFAAEINLSAMIEEKKNNQGCEENFLSFDISFLIQKTEKAHHLEELLKISFGYIAKTKIIDWFESDEWKDMRSVTLRIYVFSQDIDNSYKEIKEYLKERVCKIR
jgi:phenylalanyl-tRNA synthetase beta chain